MKFYIFNFIKESAFMVSDQQNDCGHASGHNFYMTFLLLGYRNKLEMTSFVECLINEIN